MVSRGASRGRQRRRENAPRDVLLADELQRLDEALLALLKEALSGNDGVLHEHSDGHRSDSSGNGGDVRSDLTSGVEVDVSDETRSGLASSV
jgi:hypothetical protein